MSTQTQYSSHLVFLQQAAFKAAKREEEASKNYVAKLLSKASYVSALGEAIRATNEAFFEGVSRADLPNFSLKLGGR